MEGRGGRGKKYEVPSVEMPILSVPSRPTPARTGPGFDPRPVRARSHIPGICPILYSYEVHTLYRVLLKSALQLWLGLAQQGVLQPPAKPSFCLSGHLRCTCLHCTHTLYRVASLCTPLFTPQQATCVLLDG